MRAVRLLEKAIEKEPERVLDVGVGKGDHALCFMANGALVTGIDVKAPPIQDHRYNHVQNALELADLDQKFDVVFCSHVLEHVPNIQQTLIKLKEWLKEDGWLAIAVPTARQNRIHIGHLTLWTPAHLVYNMICAGWNCREAIWYTEYLTIGLMVQNKPEIDLSWRTSLPDEFFHLSQYSPVSIHHEDGAWWSNNWPDKFEANRVPDPPAVTIGSQVTSLPPECQLAFGPNPKLRKPPHGTHTT